MAKEICISSTPHETRLAILEDDQLAEIYYERENEYTLAGSIYNGRVTRVLPGMQSAFVDLGLERDAFLYVTDFLELEDQEESEELERAAASGAAQAPREVRDVRSQRTERNGQKPEQRQEQRGALERPQQERHPEPVELVEAGDAAAAGQSAASPDAPMDDSGVSGARRWRGRRRRRGGRGHAAPQEGPGETAAEHGEIADRGESSEVAPAIHGGALPPPRTEATRSPAPPSFVLPGESLSKYGGASSSSASHGADLPAPPRPASSFKPSTLIDRPIAWDGSGLLPGESLSLRRPRQPEPEVKIVSEIPEEPSAEAAHPIEEDAFIEEASELASEAGEELEEAETAEAEQTPDATEYASPRRPEHIFVRMDFDDPDAHEIPEPGWTAPAEFRDQSATDTRGNAQAGSEEYSARAEAAEHPDGSDVESEEHSGEAEADRHASHHVDPLPPSGFRLFGIGGKKKKSDDGEQEAASSSATAVQTEPHESERASAQPSAMTSGPGFAPGHGLVEEEVIEGEEYELTQHHHKADEHDQDVFEEETQIRTGELGELLQEAHLDHHIQMAFDDKNGEEEDVDAAEEEEEEQEAVAESRPNGAEAAQPQRRDRSFRGRRGGRPERGPRGRGAARRSAQTSDLPIISDLLKPGQEILVQIAKEPIAKKGARITSHIALPGRFLVFMPTVSHVGVSRKIASDEERQRLKRILISERGESSGGFIVRTAAEGASEDELRADLRFLLHLWSEIKQRSEASKSPSLIYHDLGLIERILRDQMSANFTAIWVDTQEDYERIVRFLNHVSPSLTRRVKLYTKETPLFEHFGIQDEISKALRSKVWLKSGGSIVINQTEALVAIDINTGKYVGKTARLEDTILKTNLDAIPEIVRQIRLRDLGGIIVIDFIDMDERKNRYKVMAALEEALKNDRAPTKVLQFNDFGLVAITRKRVKQSLERTLSVPCPTCQATGMVKGPTTVANEIYIELRKMRKHFENPDVLVRVHPETVKVLKSGNGSWIEEFEELVGKNILVKSDPTLHPEQFDIQG
jgi:Rne/Rng family ribonuclease